MSCQTRPVNVGMRHVCLFFLCLSFFFFFFVFCGNSKHLSISKCGLSNVRLHSNQIEIKSNVWQNVEHLIDSACKSPDLTPLDSTAINVKSADTDEPPMRATNKIHS